MFGSSWKKVYLCSQKQSTMECNAEEIEKLKTYIESMLGRKIEHPRDFKYLEGQIECYTAMKISVSTLKRLWGYVSCDSMPSSYMLDTLAQMVGFMGWKDFQKGSVNDDSSIRIMKRKLKVSALSYGDKVVVKWTPMRMMVAKYQGRDMFTVETSENCKLIAGDSFHCTFIIDGEPLYLTDVYHPGIQVCDYVCGKMGGVKWDVIVDENNQ